MTGGSSRPVQVTVQVGPHLKTKKPRNTEFETMKTILNQVQKNRVKMDKQVLKQKEIKQVIIKETEPGVMVQTYNPNT